MKYTDLLTETVLGMDGSVDTFFTREYLYIFRQDEDNYYLILKDFNKHLSLDEIPKAVKNEGYKPPKNFKKDLEVMPKLTYKLYKIGKGKKLEPQKVQYLYSVPSGGLEL